MLAHNKACVSSHRASARRVKAACIAARKERRRSSETVSLQEFMAAVSQPEAAACGNTYDSDASRLNHKHSIS